MKTKTMFGVDFYNDLPDDVESATYNIYPTIGEAKKFASTVAVRYIFVADFNQERIFQEPGYGDWNYDDHSDTYENLIILEEYRAKWHLGM